MGTETLLEQLRALEVALHLPAARANPATLVEVLHPLFREYGRSGSVYTKEDVLRQVSSSPSTPVWSQDFLVEEVSAGVALLTYRSAHVASNGQLERHTNRLSVWQLTPSGWRMRFHQGTPTATFEKNAT